MRKHHKRSFHSFIVNHLEKGKTIFELGSGSGSSWLAENGYTVHSVEHDPQWMDKDKNVHYIYAALKEHEEIAGFRERIWYDPADLQNLPAYDLLLIDGPPGCEGRAGMLLHLELFDLNVPIVVDDVHRSAEQMLIQRLAKHLHRPYYVDPCRRRTTYGVILPDGFDWIPSEVKDAETTS